MDLYDEIIKLFLKMSINVEPHDENFFKEINNTNNEPNKLTVKTINVNI
jgi:hypothetical protein